MRIEIWEWELIDWLIKIIHIEFTNTSKVAFNIQFILIRSKLQWQHTSGSCLSVKVRGPLNWFGLYSPSAKWWLIRAAFIQALASMRTIRSASLGYPINHQTDIWPAVIFISLNQCWNKLFKLINFEPNSFCLELFGIHVWRFSPNPIYLVV